MLLRTDFRSAPKLMVPHRPGVHTGLHTAFHTEFPYSIPRGIAHFNSLLPQTLGVLYRQSSQHKLLPLADKLNSSFRLSMVGEVVVCLLQTNLVR